MKRAMTILFWVQLLAIPCGVWAQEETEIPWYLQEGVRKETGNDNPARHHEPWHAYNRTFESNR